MEHLLTEEVKIEVITLKQQGLSDSEVGDRTGVSRSGVNYIWNRLLEQGTIQNPWNLTGRPRVLTRRQEYQIIRAARHNRNLTAQEIERFVG